MDYTIFLYSYGNLIMIRKTKFRNITIINNLITPQDIAKLRVYIDYSPLQTEENNPNKFINVQDNECNAILSKAQQLLKSNIEEDFGTSVSDEGIGTVVKFAIGWERPSHCDQGSDLPT